MKRESVNLIYFENCRYLRVYIHLFRYVFPCVRILIPVIQYGQGIYYNDKRKDKEMAPVTFLEPSGSNLLSSQISRTGLTNLSVTRNNAPWINSNYPEAIGYKGANMAFAENGYYINQQTIKGDAEIFYSHTNHLKKAFKFRIHIYNCSASSVTVKRTNVGHSSGWDTAAEPIKEYFKGGTKTFTLASGGSAWLTDEYYIDVPTDMLPFSGMVPSLMIFAASLTAAMIFTYPVQRQ